MLRSITLNAASGTNHSCCRMVAPIDRDGRLDPKEWLRSQESCVVTRTQPNGTTRFGRLSFAIGPSGGLMWFIAYDDKLGAEAYQQVSAPSFREGGRVLMRDMLSGSTQEFEISANRGLSDIKDSHGVQIHPMPEAAQVCASSL